MRQVRLPGLGAPINVVTSAEAEAADLVVCVRLVDQPLGYFPDDVITDCADRCGFKIRHRPSAPQRPPKVCIQCAADRVGGGRA